MKVRILAGAAQDLLDGHRFYESLQPGIGGRFIEALFGDIDLLASTAGMHPVHFVRFHRGLSRRFPFAIYYRIESDTAVVIAVLDCRRRPAWVRSNLRQR